MPELLEVSYVSENGHSIRIAVSKTIRENLELRNSEMLDFY